MYYYRLLLFCNNVNLYLTSIFHFSKNFVQMEFIQRSIHPLKIPFLNASPTTFFVFPCLSLVCCTWLDCQLQFKNSIVWQCILARFAAFLPWIDRFLFDLGVGGGQRSGSSCVLRVKRKEKQNTKMPNK